MVEEFAIVVELLAASGGPAVGAETRLWASAKGERYISRQVVLSAGVSCVPHRAANAGEVIGTLAVSSLAVVQFISVVGVSMRSLLAHVTFATASKAAF